MATKIEAWTDTCQYCNFEVVERSEILVEYVLRLHIGAVHSKLFHANHL